MDELNNALDKLKENKSEENIQNIIKIIKINNDKKMIDAFTSFIIREKYFDDTIFFPSIISLYLNFINIDSILENVLEIIEKSPPYNNKYIAMYLLLINGYTLTQEQFDKYIYILIKSKSDSLYIKLSSNDVVYPLNINKMKSMLMHTLYLNMNSIFDLYIADVMDIDSEIIDIIYNSPNKIIETLVRTNNKNKFVKILFESKIINKFLIDFDIKNNLEFVAYLSSNDCSLPFLKENISIFNIPLIQDSIKNNIYIYKSHLIFDFLINEAIFCFDVKDLENACSVFFDNLNNDINIFNMIYSLLNHKISPSSQCIINLVNNFKNHRKKSIDFLNKQDLIRWFRQQKIDNEDKKIKYILDIINIFENFGYVLKHEDFYYLTQNRIALENIAKYNFDLNDKNFQEICAKNLFFPYDMKLKQKYFYHVFKNKLLLQDIIKISNKFNLKPNLLCLKTFYKTKPHQNIVKSIIKKYGLKPRIKTTNKQNNSNIKKTLQN
jgi:hypothetical protein